MTAYRIRIPTKKELKHVCGVVNVDKFPPTKMILTYLHSFNYVDTYRLDYTNDLGWHVEGNTYISDTFTYDASLILGQQYRESIITTAIIDSFAECGHTVSDICYKIKKNYFNLFK